MGDSLPKRDYRPNGRNRFRRLKILGKKGFLLRLFFPLTEGTFIRQKELNNAQRQSAALRS